MNRTGGRILRAIVAGLVIAAGIGLGAANSWWVALFFGVPLIVGGITVMPRPTQQSELPAFRRAPASSGVPITVESITRSSLVAGDIQPTLVTATIEPPNDTSYRARWLTTMNRADYRALLARPTTTITSAGLPRRDVARTPEFTAQPGIRAVLYPAVAVVAAVALLLAVPMTGWRVDTESATDRISRVTDDAMSGLGDDRASAVDLNAELRQLLAAIAARGGNASDNLLSVSINPSAGRTSTSAQIYDPGNGRSVNLWKSGDDWQTSDPQDTTKRRPDTFRATDIASTDLNSMTGQMHTRLAAVGVEPDELERLTISRPDRDGAVRVVGSFDRKTGSSVDFEGSPDGRVADYWDPGHFAVSFAMARDVFTAQSLPSDQKFLRRFEIRGIRRATPTMYAGSIQNSGGVLIEYSGPRSSGQIVLVPGHFPEVRNYGKASRPDGFALDDVSEQVFEDVRRQVMRRGRVEDFDTNAVDIQMTTVFQFDGVPVIQVRVGSDEAAAGTFAPDGRFLKSGYF